LLLAPASWLSEIDGSFISILGREICIQYTPRQAC
jgi:hypothetical protein